MLAALALTLMVFGACAAEEDPALEATQAPPSPATGDIVVAPTVAFNSPTEGATVPAGDLIVAIKIESFTVVDKLGQAPVEGEGHVHFYIDVDEIPTTQGQPAVTDDKTTYHATAETSHTWPDVEPGSHKLGVQLVNNNHTPLGDPVTAEITVTVE